MIRGTNNFVRVTDFMTYMPITPLGRPVDGTLIERHNDAIYAPQCEGVDKYEVVQHLTQARMTFDVTDRQLTVLQALLSFYPARVISAAGKAPIIFPSNAAICERLHGMPCSTMRRHVAALIKAGFLLRRDSPNGKRYVKRAGGDHQPFGFDLSPLITRASEIATAAREAERAAEGLELLRRQVSLKRRDLAALVAYGRHAHPDATNWDALEDFARLTARAVRRRLDADDLKSLDSKIDEALTEVNAALIIEPPDQMSTDDAQNEQHIQNSEKDKITEKAEPSSHQTSSLSLDVVRAQCKEIQLYSQGQLRSWQQLFNTAHVVQKMMGISPDVWDQARRCMGDATASVTIAAMLERAGDIRSPGAYLRDLTKRYEAGVFSVVPMVLALRGGEVHSCELSG